MHDVGKVASGLLVGGELASGGAVSEALGGNSAAEGLIDGPVVGRHGDRRGGEIDKPRQKSFRY